MWRAAGVFAAGLACATVARGAGETAAAAPAPSPIDAAKRDYDAIKASKFSLEQQKLDLPKTATPELHLENPAAGEFILTGRNPEDKSKAAAQRRGQRGTNWLVDAMLGDKDKAAKTGTGETSFTNDEDKTDTAETGELKLTDLSARKPTGANSDRRRGDERAPAVEKMPSRVANPLDGFLADWMTPGDYQLLKAAPEAGRGAAPVVSLTGPAASPDVRGVRVPGPQTRGPGGNAPTFEARVNPYLAEQAPTGDLGFNAPTLVGPPAGRASMPPPVAPVVPVVEPPPPKPAAAAAAGEIIKARDDAKYFPQLKRF